MFFHCVFKTLFLFGFSCVFEQVGTVKSIKNTAQGSKNYVCWKSNKIGPGPGLGWIWESFLGSSWWQMCFFVEKVSARKQSEKRYPRKVKLPWMGRSQGSWTAPPKVKDCLSNKQQLNNKLQQFNNSTKTPTIAESLLQFDCCCLCFLFDFKFKRQWSDTPWARPDEFTVLYSQALQPVPAGKRLSSAPSKLVHAPAYLGAPTLIGWAGGGSPGKSESCITIR